MRKDTIVKIAVSKKMAEDLGKNQGQCQLIKTLDMIKDHLEASKRKQYILKFKPDRKAVSLIARVDPKPVCVVSLMMFVVDNTTNTNYSNEVYDWAYALLVGKSTFAKNAFLTARYIDDPRILEKVEELTESENIADSSDSIVEEPRSPKVSSQQESVQLITEKTLANALDQIEHKVEEIISVQLFDAFETQEEICRHQLELARELIDQTRSIIDAVDLITKKLDALTKETKETGVVLTEEEVKRLLFKGALNIPF